MVKGNAVTKAFFRTCGEAFFDAFSSTFVSIVLTFSLKDPAPAIGTAAGDPDVKFTLFYFTMENCCWQLRIRETAFKFDVAA